MFHINPSDILYEKIFELESINVIKYWFKIKKRADFSKYLINNIEPNSSFVRSTFQRKSYKYKLY